jgi:hypothetical protein
MGQFPGTGGWRNREQVRVARFHDTLEKFSVELLSWRPGEDILSFVLGNLPHPRALEDTQFLLAARRPSALAVRTQATSKYRSQAESSARSENIGGFLLPPCGSDAQHPALCVAGSGCAR